MQNSAQAIYGALRGGACRGHLSCGPDCIAAGGCPALWRIHPYSVEPNPHPMGNCSHIGRQRCRDSGSLWAVSLLALLRLLPHSFFDRLHEEGQAGVTTSILQVNKQRPKKQMGSRSRSFLFIICSAPWEDIHIFFLEKGQGEQVTPAPNSLPPAGEGAVCQRLVERITINSEAGGQKASGRC